MDKRHLVRVAGLPSWLDAQQLLGPGDFRFEGGADGALCASGELDAALAADLQARLRGLGLGGRTLEVSVEPPLARALVRAARTEEARRRRHGSVGFSRRGARLDDEGRVSLTAEELALAIGRRAERARVVDACCGAGGNAIGFARAGCEVIAIERDAARLELARHNAALYGVGKRIRFVHGDAVDLVPGLEAELLFVDPPWGARYDKRRVALADLAPLPALLALPERFARTWAKLPPSFDTTQVPGAKVRAIFGSGQGDARRVKFLLLER